MIGMKKWISDDKKLKFYNNQIQYRLNSIILGENAPDFDIQNKGKNYKYNYFLCDIYCLCMIL